jgi:hypothetical protein
MALMKLHQAFTEFDNYNRQDRSLLNKGDHSVPEALFFAQRLYDWVLKLDPNAGEALLLASRSQHIGRWEIPRSTYPEGRVGYLQWRKDLSVFHANKSAGILEAIGYEFSLIERVKEIIQKKNLRNDPDVQTMEDALCLVFLEFQYDDLIAQHSEEKMIRILQKTWKKMSDLGHQAALKLDYSEVGSRILHRALAG